MVIDHSVLSFLFVELSNLPLFDLFVEYFLGVILIVELAGGIDCVVVSFVDCAESGVIKCDSRGFLGFLFDEEF